MTKKSSARGPDLVLQDERGGKTVYFRPCRMPELPDITVYIERLEALVGGKRLEKVRLSSPFVLRTFDPPIREAETKRVTGFRRMGKRIVFELEAELFLVIHLMISGRLRWRERGVVIQRKIGLAAFDFSEGSLLFTEAASKKRASIFVVKGEKALAPFERGGVEPLESTRTQFTEALQRENRTLKRAMTDPRILSGVGNAYSDEILFHAQLSPVKRTRQLRDDELGRLFESTRTVLEQWTDRLRNEVGDGFPEKVTAFHDEMAVHGRYKKPCRVCRTAIQRIRLASNEFNYCPRCQTGGKLLADRSLSRLLKSDWPKSIEELEELEATRPAVAAPTKGRGKQAAAKSRATKETRTKNRAVEQTGTKKSAAKKRAAKPSAPRASRKRATT